MDENTGNFQKLMHLIYDADSRKELDDLSDMTISLYLDGLLYDDDYDTIFGYIYVKMAKFQ